MLSIEFDSPSFAVGTVIKGKINVNLPMKGKAVDIEKFTVVLQRSTAMLADHHSNDKWTKMWEETKIPVTVEVKGNGSDVVPFEVPLPPNLYYSSDGQTGNIKVTFINTVKVVGVPKATFSGNLETSAVVKLTPRQDPVPVSDTHTHQFYKFCCFGDGNVVLEVEIPNMFLDREKRVIPFKVRSSKNTSGHKIKRVSAALTYCMSYATSSFDIWVLNPASAEVSVEPDPDSESTLPLLLTGKTGWQSLIRDYSQPQPLIMTKLDVRFWFEGKEDPVTRSFDVSIV